MKSVTGKGMGFAAILGVILAAGAWPAGAATNKWKLGSTDVSWTNTLNWTLGVKPGPTDRAQFAFVSPYYGGTLSSRVDFAESVDNVYADTGDMTFQWYGTGTLTVANDFFFQNSIAQSYFEPQLIVGGRFYTTAYWDGRARLKFGNAGAYTSGNIFGGGIHSYGPGLDLGGTTTVSTIILASGRDVLGWYTDGGMRNMGVVKFNGSGTVFGPNLTFDLRRGGTLWFPSSNNFSNISTQLFSGGMLRLGAITNVFPTYTNGFAVNRGSLAIAGNGSLGMTDANGITLGSPGHYGYLLGGAADSAGNRITRPITLAGNGGVISPMEIFLNSDINIGTPVTGSGALIKTGEKVLWLRNAGVGTTSSYSGGTIVANGALALETARTLGTGNVAIRGGGGLYLYSPANLAAGATVLVGGDLYQRGLLVLRTAMTPPAIDTNSTGTIVLDAITNSAPLSSIGACFLGGLNTSTYSAPSLPAGTGSTYRIGDVLDPLCTGAGGAHRLTLDVNNGVNGAGVLTGPNDLLVAYGGAILNDINAYNGVTTIRNNMRYDTYEAASFRCQFQPGGSPLGSPTAAVNLYSSLLQFYDINNAGVPIGKGDLNVQGRSHLLIGAVSSTCSVTFASLNRLNRGQVAIFGSLQLGDRERVFVTAAPTPVNGIVDPWMICDWQGQTPSFLTYGATGFVRAAFSASVPGVAFPTDGTSVVQVTANTTLGANADVYALRVNAPSVQINRGAGTNVTLRSGGLILANTTSGTKLNCDFTFGATGEAEGLIYCSKEGILTELAGRLVTTNGFTKGGPGILTVSSNNAATLSGKIVVNGGILHAYRDNSLGTARVYLNGGSIRHESGQSISRTISMGPVGGFIGDNSTFYGAFVDDVPGVPGGPLVVHSSLAFWAKHTFTGPMILMPGVGITLRSDAAPSRGPVTVMNGAQLKDSTTGGGGWTNMSRFNLRGGGPSPLVGALMLAPEGGSTRTWRIGSIEGSGNISLGGESGSKDDSTLMVGGDNTSCDYHGSLFDYRASAYHKLIKEGTGTWTLWGVNDHHGATTVTQGELRVNGAINFSAITVTNGAVLSGHGYLGAAVNVTSGCKLSGSLVFGGALTLTNTCTVEAVLNGNTPVSGYGQMTPQNALNLNGSILLVTLGFAPAVGQSFTIVNIPSAALLTGQFACGDRITAPYNGRTYLFHVDYTASSVILTRLVTGTVMTIR